MADTTRRARIIIEARDEASGAIKGIGQGTDRMGGILQGMGRIGVTALKGLAGAALAAGAASIKLAMDMEQTRIAFTTLLGSAEAASKHLEELRAFAAKTPFQFTELTQASRRLMAFGFEAEKVIPMLTDIGDAVSAMGGSSEMIDRVTLALGQMSAKGKVSAQEMLQLTEAGIPAWRFLAEQMGVTTAEVQKMSEKGLIPAGKAIDAILKGMREDFGGMMAEQAKTAAGQLSNVVDSLEEIGVTIGEIALPAIKTFIGMMKEGLDVLKLVVTWEKQTTDVFKKHQAEMFALATATDKTRISLEEYNKELIRAGKVTGDVKVWARVGQDAMLDQMESTELARKGLVRYGDEYLLLSDKVQIATQGQIDAIDASNDALRRMQNVNANETLREFARRADEGTRALEAMKGMADGSAARLGDLEKALGEVDTQMGMLKDIMGGAVGKEMKDFNETQEENRAKAAELRAELDELSASHGRAVTSQKDNTLSANELQLATLQLAQKQQQLAETTDPMKQAQLAVQIDKLTAKMGGATEATTKFVDNSKKMGEIEGELAELDQAYAANAAEHEKATSRIIFDIAAQQLAMDGLTMTEVEALRSIAVQWGLMDEATANATRNVLGAVVQLSEDQSLPNFRKNMQDAKEEAMDFGAELVRLPREIDIRIRIHTEGVIPNLPTPHEAPIPMQHGGALGGGQAALVGERGPELFVPRMPGFVVNQQQAAMAAAAAMSRAGAGTGRGETRVVNNFNTVINDQLTGALWRTLIASRRAEANAGVM